MRCSIELSKFENMTLNIRNKQFTEMNISFDAIDNYHKEVTMKTDCNEIDCQR